MKLPFITVLSTFMASLPMVNCYASGLAMSVNATLALGAAKVFLPVSGTDEIFTT